MNSGAHYDRRAVVYDAVVGRSFYHRIFWGTSAQSYSRFARHALDAAGDGCFAEAGCGSLLFSAPMYRNSRAECVVLADRSLQMLERARKRLAAANGVVPAGIALVHSDIAAMPVRSGVFASVLCLNV